MSYCRSLMLASCIAPLAALATCADAWGQEEFSLRDLEKRGTTVQKWTRSPITGENRAIFDQYFDRYYFPSMVKTDPKSLEELGDKRVDLFARYLWDAHPSVQKELTEKAYGYFVRVVGSNRAPAPIRYNALLVLGLLDEKYATRSDATLKPLPDANRLLCQIVKMCVDKQRLPGYMEVGALVGLERHTKHYKQLNRDSLRLTASALLGAIKQEEYSAGTTREVKTWMKLQAATAIANLETAGGKGVFAKAIASLVADDKADLETRATAAGLLAKLNMAGVPAEVGGEIAAAVKGLACAVANAEKEDAESFIEVQANLSRGYGLTEPSKRYRETETGWEYERDGLVAHFSVLNKGLTAVTPIAGAGADAITQIQNAVQSTIGVAGGDNIDLDVTDSIRELYAVVMRVGGCQPVEDAAAEEENLFGAAE